MHKSYVNYLNLLDPYGKMPTFLKKIQATSWVLGSHKKSLEYLGLPERA